MEKFYNRACLMPELISGKRQLLTHVEKDLDATSCKYITTYRAKSKGRDEVCTFAVCKT